MTKYIHERIPTLESVAEAMQELGKHARFLLKRAVLDRTRSRTFKNPANYQVELTQVAAVAIAARTNYLMKESGISQEAAERIIWNDVLAERRRQDEKFNHQMPIESDPLLWTTSLIEEVAEVIAEIELE